MGQTTTEQQHPNPIPNPHHRKIELQSLADLTYLQRNLADAAKDKLDLHFPPQHSAPAEVITLGSPTSSKQQEESQTREPDEDPLRRSVRLLVDEFLRQTFNSAAHSISVNGIDATNLPPSKIASYRNVDSSKDDNSAGAPSSANEIEGLHYTYAPYDPRLSKRLQTLHQELETLTSEVSKLRCVAPKRAADLYTATLEAALKADDDKWDAEQVDASNEPYQGLELDSQRDDWNQDTREVFEMGVSNLAILSNISQKQGDETSLMETAAKAQRARRVVMEFE